MAKSTTPTLAGWGRLPAPGRELCRSTSSRARAARMLSRGLGRSYGDSSLPAHAERQGRRHARWPTASSPSIRRRGVLRAEAGLSLAELNRLFMPRGWFTPVTPGTKFVTLGGMVASDVHGKNHHVAGCFGGTCARCGCASPTTASSSAAPARAPDLFYGTIGGMGLARPRPRGRGRARAHPEPVDASSRAERVDDIEEYPRGARAAAPLADDDRLDRLPAPRTLAGSRHLHGRALGRRGRSAGDRRPAAARRDASRSSCPTGLSTR